jgi:Transaldolase/Fructose-6-phosphate aldolase
MSAVAELNPRSLAVTEAGVSVWLDQIRRSMIEGGELARMVSVESLRGVTSNPAIFEKAILGSDDYDEDLRTLVRENLDSVAIYEHSAIRDVQLTADALAGVHRESGGRDGFVSLEVSPDLAHDTEGALDQVRSFWRRVDRVTVMIKIPGTPEGVPAIEQGLYEGIKANVTLLLAVAAYDKVAEAFIRALERRHAEGLELSVNSVASFFVSIRSATVAATTFGYGPRFLHSTGQLHKGGPPTGRFLQLVDTPARDAEIPGAGYSFGTLIAAQAAGDLETLRSHGLGAERVELEGDPVAAVRRLTARIKAILEGS